MAGRCSGRVATAPRCFRRPVRAAGQHRGRCPRYRGCLEPEKVRPMHGPVGPRDEAVGRCREYVPKFAALIAAPSARVGSRGAGRHRGSVVRYPRSTGAQPGAWEWSVIRRVLDGRSRMILPDNGLWNHLPVRGRTRPSRTQGRGQPEVERPGLQRRRRRPASPSAMAEAVPESSGAELEFVGSRRAGASALIELLPPTGRPHITLDNTKASSSSVTARWCRPHRPWWKPSGLKANPVTGEDYPSTRTVRLRREDRCWTPTRKPWSGCANTRGQAPDVRHPMPHPRRRGRRTRADDYAAWRRLQEMNGAEYPVMQTGWAAAGTRCRCRCPRRGLGHAEQPEHREHSEASCAEPARGGGEVAAVRTSRSGERAGPAARHGELRRSADSVSTRRSGSSATRKAGNSGLAVTSPASPVNWARHPRGRAGAHAQVGSVDPRPQGGRQRRRRGDRAGYEMAGTPRAGRAHDGAGPAGHRGLDIR